MPPRIAAFTLLEMIVVLAIASLVIGIGVGAMQRINEDHQLLKVAHEAESVLMQAMTRTVATAQGQQVELDALAGGMKLTVNAGGKSFQVMARVDTPAEVEYLLHGGILQFVLRSLAKQ